MRVGVIGHQRLNAAVVRIVTREVPALLGSAYNVVVSTLKPGAPHLIAELARARGHPLEVVVPSRDYESSFPDREALESYRGLLDPPTQCIELSHDRWTEDAFLEAGREVVKRSDKVIAVWDGRPARRKSGTAQLIAYAGTCDPPVPVDTIWLRKLFLSYAFGENVRRISRVHYLLSKQPDVEPFFWSDATRPTMDHWISEVGVALAHSAALVAFVDTTPGQTQLTEIQAALDRRIPIYLVDLGADDPLPDWVLGVTRQALIRSRWTAASPWALDVARQLIGHLQDAHWCLEDDVPTSYLFDYEKHVIEAYAGGRIDDRHYSAGAPDSWPAVARKSPVDRPNPVPETLIGSHREDAHVLVDARASVAPASPPLTFLEAQPRPALHFPVQNGHPLRVRVVVSGGVSPGTNAVISEIARRHGLYAHHGGHALDLQGYRQGFRGILEVDRPIPLRDMDHREIAHRGGSILGTSRVASLLGPDPSDRATVGQLVGILGGVDILYVIGGDGSMRAAHAISTVAADQNSPLSVVGIPKTTDNDILWVWQSFGHLSSVQRARDFLLELHTEVVSNPRLAIVQLFGSDSGFVVANAGLASGVCNGLLIPEEHFDLREVSRRILGEMCRQLHEQEMPHGILVLSETAIPGNVDDYLNDEYVALTPGERAAVEQFVRDNHRIRGQTPDLLRNAGMKIVSRVLQRDIHDLGGYWSNFRVFGNEPRHLIRAMEPSASDVIVGQRLGANAVDAAMAGYHDCMVSHWLTEFVLVPLSLVVLGRKRVPLGGAFWRAAKASTGL